MWTRITFLSLVYFRYYLSSISSTVPIPICCLYPDHFIQTYRQDQCERPVHSTRYEILLEVIREVIREKGRNITHWDVLSERHSFLAYCGPLKYNPLWNSLSLLNILPRSKSLLWDFYICQIWNSYRPETVFGLKNVRNPCMTKKECL